MPADPVCEADNGVDTREWRQVRVASFTFRLPPGYSDTRLQGIDSHVAEWRARGGREIFADFGIYNAPFHPERTAGIGRPVAVCQSAEGTELPQIVVLRTPEGGYRAQLYWLVQNGRAVPTGPDGRLLRESLYLRASGARASELPELLAIARSVQPAR